MNKEDRKDLVERLREEALALQQTAWSRLDGGQQCSLNANLAEGAADEIDRLRRELEEARKALEPFADAVFNDNGDMTVNRSFPTYDDFVRAYFAQKKARAALRAGEEGR